MNLPREIGYSRAVIDRSSGSWKRLTAVAMAVAFALALGAGRAQAEGNSRELKAPMNAALVLTGGPPAVSVSSPPTDGSRRPRALVQRTNLDSMRM